MIKWFLRFLQGSGEYTISGAFPERFLNLCGQNRIVFRNLRWMDEFTLRLQAPLAEEKRLRELAKRCQCELHRNSREGLPVLLLRARRRYAFLTGFFLCLAAVCFLSHVIWKVEVSGNEEVSSREIVTAFQRLGFHIGTFGPGVDREELCQQVLLQVDGLSYCALNITGTRAEILVREVQPQPEVVDEDAWVDVVASRAGVIASMRPLAGQSMVQVGDAVEEGQILLSGTVEVTGPELAGGEVLGSYSTHAMGDIQAYTRRELTGMIPLEAPVKAYTGKVRQWFGVTIFGHDLFFCGKSGIYEEEYDKIIKTMSLSLPGIGQLPVSLVWQTCRGYTTVSGAVSPSKAEAMLKEDLSAQLTDQMGEDGTVLEENWVVSVDSGVLTVTLTADCLEQIGREQPAG